MRKQAPLFLFLLIELFLVPCNLPAQLHLESGQPSAVEWPTADQPKVSTMGKNIVICCDGTNNEFGRTNTNVVRLYQCLDHSFESRQIVYYDPGVGTLAPPNLSTRIGKNISRIFGKAFGTGILPNVEEAVHFLMRNYEPGDRIYIFGFSRGAYTARAIAALLHKSGLPGKDADNLMPYFTRNLQNTQDWVISNQFKKTFGRECPVYFLGLWDTVSTIGWVYNPKSLPYTRNNPEVSIVRHAVSLDERRCFYRTNLWGSPKEAKEPTKLIQDIQQVWFLGVHSDVGGGYLSEESSLWKLSFEWMYKEAKAAGVQFDEERVKTTLEMPPTSKKEEWYRSDAHSSLKGVWWICELLPKKYWDNHSQPPRYRFRIPLGKPREVPPGSLLHHSIINRMAVNPKYRPRNLSDRFITEVLQKKPTEILVVYTP